MGYSYKCYSDTKQFMKKYVNAEEGAIIYGISKSTAPDGYVLNPDEQKVTFTYVDDKTPVIKERSPQQCLMSLSRQFCFVEPDLSEEKAEYARFTGMRLMPEQGQSV